MVSLDDSTDPGYTKTIGKRGYGKPLFSNIFSKFAEYCWMMDPPIMTSLPSVHPVGKYCQPMEDPIGSTPEMVRRSWSSGYVPSTEVKRAQEGKFDSGMKSGRLEYKVTARAISGLLCTMACLLLASFLLFGPEATPIVAAVFTAAVAAASDAKGAKLLKFLERGATLAYASHCLNTIVTRGLRLIRTYLTSCAALLILLALVPQASGTPLPAPKYPGPDFEAEYRTAWHYVRPWIPWVEVIVTSGYIINLYRTPVGIEGHTAPVTLGTSAISAAFIWFVVGTKQPNDDESFVPITFTTYVCTWVSFMAKSRRSLEYRDVYLSCILLIGAAATLSVTSLSSRSVSWDEYWSQSTMNAPLALTVTSFIVCAWWPWRLAARDHQD